jgi:hypothetical protein
MAAVVSTKLLNSINSAVSGQAFRVSTVEPRGPYAVRTVGSTMFHKSSDLAASFYSVNVQGYSPRCGDFRDFRSI